MIKITTKSLYQELIKQTLIDNDVRTMTFKGNGKFAKKYSHVYITKDAHDYSMLVFLNDLETPLGNFHFDFTLDYARLIDMIETDLFNMYHKVDTQYFEFRMY
jgi:hypothetical protein